MSKYDDLVKRLGRLRPDDFVQWLCPEVSDIQEVSFEDREFEFTYRRVDLLYRVKASEIGEFFFHLEFQLELKENFAIRIHEYSTRIRREFGLPVKTVVVFLDSTQPIRDLLPVDRCEFAGELISEFRYTKIVLPDEKWRTILKQGLPALFPLIPITMIPKGEEHQALSKAAQCIEKLEDVKLRGELGAILYLIGGFGHSGIIRTVIGEKLMQDLMQSVTYREIVEAGELKGKRETLITILTKLFGDLPNNITQQLQAIDSVERLNSLIDLALTAPSLKEFMAISKL